ncbi:MAG: histidinol phosphate phosphatase domain-containing protein [Candidatus Omnitrophica bacterium]|nr:histidinol phosphate phosphatase domain-containing protein [Candidatus Omnitrophota bacterium]MDD5553848.1 histidinol phosphate phosphatase domain-containing protein [Candidatus Omnitrophota bacterium]
MYNLHCHSLLSDGILLPSEVAVHYAEKGYFAIAITDHADYSNIDFVMDGILKFISHWPKDSKIQVLPGVELTHLPLEQFKPLVKKARRRGMKIIVGHGETTAEPVVKGTNRACMEAGVDILAHPGLISEEDAQLAAEKGVFLELTSRSGHRDSNLHVAEQALRAEANLIFSTDSHRPEDIISPRELIKIAFGAALNESNIEAVCVNIKDFLRKKGVK